MKKIIDENQIEMINHKYISSFYTYFYAFHHPKD